MHRFVAKTLVAPHQSASDDDSDFDYLVVWSIFIPANLPVILAFFQFYPGIRGYTSFVLEFLADTFLRRRELYNIT